MPFPEAAFPYSGACRPGQAPRGCSARSALRSRAVTRRLWCERFPALQRRAATPTFAPAAARLASPAVQRQHAPAGPSAERQHRRRHESPGGDPESSAERPSRRSETTLYLAGSSGRASERSRNPRQISAQCGLRCKNRHGHSAMTTGVGWSDKGAYEHLFYTALTRVIEPTVLGYVVYITGFLNPLPTQPHQ